MKLRKEEKFPKLHLLVKDGQGFKSSYLPTTGQTDEDKSPGRGGEHRVVLGAALMAFQFACGIIWTPLCHPLT